MNDSQYLTCKEVLQRYRVSRTTLYRWIGEAWFPPARQIGPKAVRWAMSDLTEWEQGRNRPSPLGKPTAPSARGDATLAEGCFTDSEDRSPRLIETPGYIERTALDDLGDFRGRVRRLEFLRDDVPGPKKRAQMRCLSEALNPECKPAVILGPDGMVLGMSGMRRCGYLECPACGPVRAREIGLRAQSLIDAARRPLFHVILTASHQRDELLNAVVRDVHAAFRGLRSSGVLRGKVKRGGMEIVFWVRECPHGPHGWHPHFHILVEFAGCADELTDLLAPLWGAQCAQVSRRADRGCRVTAVQDDFAAYATKQWRMPLGGDTGEPLALLQQAMKGDAIAMRFASEYWSHQAGERMTQFWFKAGTRRRGASGKVRDSAAAVPSGGSAILLTRRELYRLPGRGGLSSVLGHERFARRAA